VDYLDNHDFGFEGNSDRTIETQEELLTLRLLREAIEAQNPGDPVMADFANYVLPNLLRIATGVTAKGGKFFDTIDQQRQTEGLTKVRRNNAADQSLNAHLLNGLFPANLIERRLQQLDTTVRRAVEEKERRIAIAGFILHDFEKFPDVPENSRRLSPAKHRQIIDEKIRQLGLDKFIDPKHPETYQNYLDDLLCLAYNAQRRWDTNWNFSESGLDPALKDRTLRSLSDLTCLADSLASIVKRPQDAENPRLKEIIHNLSDGQLKLTYHSIAENRGVLTNIVNNALIQAHITLNTDTQTYYEPLLYLPTGVIYLATRHAPPVSTENLPELVVNKIKSLCTEKLKLKQTGFNRDGKGIKYAEYYDLFFDPPSLMQVALDATLRIVNSQKKSRARSRSEKLVNLVKRQKQGNLPVKNFEFSDDIRIDQIAEFCDLVSRKIWNAIVNRIRAVSKKNKNSPSIPTLDLTDEIVKFWNLEQYTQEIRHIQDLSDTGGTPYEWYYIAAKYLQKNPGIEDVRQTCTQLINYLTNIISPILAQYKFPDGWEDLRQWVLQVVMLPTVDQQLSPHTRTENFLKELNNYNAAKKSGRGRQLICSISHSAYTVTEQMESAVLFTPQVYTNKQMLGGSDAKRHISSIAGLEIMLRQILMNQTQAVGKIFEDSNYRYLYLYPTYYFTPETNKFLHKVYSRIAQTRFDTSIRNHFITQDLQAHLEKENYQSVDAFLINENPDSKTFKLSYPEDEPLTFYFMALPPEQKNTKPPKQKNTNTGSWIMPCWLALTFPIILDVKTVVSESPIPPFNDGAEFEETVFFDSAPYAFRTLVKRDKFRLDYILEGWNENDIQYPAPLNVLTAAYAIHLDVNARREKSVYDPNWGKFTELAQDFETSPLYVFSYLNRWVRKQKLETARIEKIRLYTYYFYPCFDPYAKFDPMKEELIIQQESSLNHPQKLTELYRRFYRANRRYNPKSNAILKPINIAAETILKAESSVFHGETLIAAVAAEIFKLMDRVRASTAEGRWVISKREEERQAILDFARYFVVEVFEKSFAGDRARLAGRQLNLIRDTCEFLYRLEDDKENAQNHENSPESDRENE